jgi:hypothetical protein
VAVPAVYSGAEPVVRKVRLGDEIRGCAKHKQSDRVVVESSDLDDSSPVGDPFLWVYGTSRVPTGERNRDHPAPDAEAR